MSLLLLVSSVIKTSLLLWGRKTTSRNSLSWMKSCRQAAAKSSPPKVKQLLYMPRCRWKNTCSKNNNQLKISTSSVRDAPLCGLPEKMCVMWAGFVPGVNPGQCKSSQANSSLHVCVKKAFCFHLDDSLQLKKNHNPL